VNTPAALGAVGYTTNLFPSMTLGCGAPGNNITSDNISPLHLIHLKRVAFGVRDVEAPKAETVRVSRETTARATIEEVVDRFLGKKPAPKIAEPVKSAAATAPRLASYAELEPKAAPQPAAPSPPKPVPFVCEDDVRAAIRGNSRIVVGKKTIVTPSARDLAEANDVFVPGD
jgi:hypothetical protein